jgi:sigma-B regulation protein RsbU (phosphoserine phosphatase)
VKDADSLQVSAVQAVMVAPMAFDDQLFGVLQVDTTASVAAFNETDMHLLVAVASQVAAALAYAGLHERRLKQELLEHDLALARRIQRQFLPDQPPALDGFGFAVIFEPALAVGGDFFDFLPLERGRLAMIVGDVSGKGVAAALYGAAVLAELRGLLQQYADPVRVLQDLNVRLSQRDREGMFVTLALATLALDTGELTLATAGHPLPVVRNSGRDVGVLGQTGPPPLGIDEEARFEAHRYALDAGDTVVAYTDGIPEAVDAAGELFGQERLAAAVGQSDGSAQGACDGVMNATLGFLAGRPFGDDVTIACMAKQG